MRRRHVQRPTAANRRPHRARRGRPMGTAQRGPRSPAGGRGMVAARTASCQRPLGFCLAPGGGCSPASRAPGPDDRRARQGAGSRAPGRGDAQSLGARTRPPHGTGMGGVSAAGAQWPTRMGDARWQPAVFWPSTPGSAPRQRPPPPPPPTPQRPRAAPIPHVAARWGAWRAAAAYLITG